MPSEANRSQKVVGKSPGRKGPSKLPPPVFQLPLNSKSLLLGVEDLRNSIHSLSLPLSTKVIFANPEPPLPATTSPACWPWSVGFQVSLVVAVHAPSGASCVMMLAVSLYSPGRAVTRSAPSETSYAVSSGRRTVQWQLSSSSESLNSSERSGCSQGGGGSSPRTPETAKTCSFGSTGSVRVSGCLPAASGDPLGEDHDPRRGVAAAVVAVGHVDRDLLAELRATRPSQ